MYLQITNTTLEKHNQSIVQVGDTKTIASVIISKCKSLGWNVKQCITNQVRDELVNTVYRGVDGKSIPNGRKQYRARALKTGTINKTNTLTMKVV